MRLISERLRGVIRSRALPRVAARVEAVRMAEEVAAAGGEDVLGIVFFGSRKTRAQPDAWSAFDLFVLTRDYLGFYRALRRSGRLRRSPRLVAALNRLLPPNQVSLWSGTGAAALRAKCAVIALSRFLREASPARHDHFCLGRLFQPAEILYARDADTRERLLDALVQAHLLTYTWARPWLPERFDAEGYARGLLALSLSREIRPEPRGRAEALFEAQRDYLVEVYAVLLEELAAAGELRQNADATFSLARPSTAAERLRLEGYFGWSLVRATARWAKYMVTFEGWLDYIVRKARRHTREEIVLTPWERRLPVVFLWPRVLRYFRDKERPGGDP